MYGEYLFWLVCFGGRIRQFGLTHVENFFLVFVFLVLVNLGRLV